MEEKDVFVFGNPKGAIRGEANLRKKVGSKRAKELLDKIAEATMPKGKEDKRNG